MATRYGYDKAIGLTGPLSVDWSQVTGETVKYLNQLQEKKDTTRKELATESRELAQQLAKNPYDYTSKYYGFWGKSSNQIMDLMTSLNDNFQNGNISKTDRDIKSANLQGQVEQYIAASQKFSQQEKERAKNSGPNGMYGAEDIFENEILSTALNYENIEPLFDPDSHSFNVLATGSDGVTRIMSGNEVFSSVERPVIGRYNMNENIKKAFERINVKTITKADGSIVAGDFVTTQGEEADNALRNLAQTMIQQPVQLRSMLSSYPISIEEDGKVKNYEFDREFLPSEAYDIGGKVNMDVVNKLHQENPTIFYRDIQGNYYESDRARDIGEKYAMEQLTLAAEYTKKEAKVTTETDDSFNKLRQTINTVKDAGFQPSVKMVRALLKKSGLSQDQINSFTGEFIQKDRDIEEANKKKFSANAQQAFKEWFPNWLSETPPGGAKKYDYNTVVSMFETSPFEIVSEGGSIKVLYDGEEFYDFGQKSVRVPQPNMSAEDKKATFDFFKNKMRAKLGDEESIKIMLTIDPSLRKDILNIEDVNTTDTSDVDYSNL